MRRGKRHLEQSVAARITLAYGPSGPSRAGEERTQTLTWSMSSALATTAISLFRPQAATTSCLIRAVGAGPLLPDRIVGSESGSVRLRWTTEHDVGLRAELAGPDYLDEGETPVAFGHQAYPGCCPLTAEDEFIGEGKPVERAVSLGAVAIPIDSDGRVLLTRRPRAMRTFPGAWVLPGGRVDATDRSVMETALRELSEETGIIATPAQCEPTILGMWESAFPVSADEWRAARLAGKRTAHTLISFVIVHLGSGSGGGGDGVEAAAVGDHHHPHLVQLEPDECECACWVPLEEVATALCGEGSVAAPEFYQPAPQATTGAAVELPSVPSASLAGVYPNSLGEGIGRGHLWALRHLAHRGLRPPGEDGAPSPP